MNDRLDYVFFVYGFAFVALALLLRGLAHRERGHLPWHWLALFGLLHGGNEWLDMLVVSLGDSPAFAAVRLIILGVSFAALFEFGRQGLSACGMRMPGRWIYLPLACAVAAGGFGGTNGLNIAIRYSLGLLEPAGRHRHPP
jgi:hypothetical protein